MPNVTTWPGTQLTEGVSLSTVFDNAYSLRLKEAVDFAIAAGLLPSNAAWVHAPHTVGQTGATAWDNAVSVKLQQLTNAIRTALGTLPTPNAPTGTLDTVARTYTVATTSYPLSELEISANSGATFTAASGYVLTLPDTAVASGVYRWRYKATSQHEQSPALLFPGITAVAGPPSDITMYPTEGRENTQVTFVRSGFAGIQSVVFTGGAAGFITQNSEGQVVVLAPAGMQTGPVAITLADNSVVYSPSFTALAGIEPDSYVYNRSFAQAATAATGPTDNFQNLNVHCTIAGDGVARFVDSVYNFPNELTQRAHGMPGNSNLRGVVRVTSAAAGAKLQLIGNNGNQLCGIIDPLTVGDHVIPFSSAVPNDLYQWMVAGTADVTLLDLNPPL